MIVTLIVLVFSLIYWMADRLVGYESALEQAVFRCDFKEVRKLLTEGANPNDYKRRPPLYFSGRCQPPLQMERLLLEAGANPDPILDPGTSSSRSFLHQLKKAPRSDEQLIQLLESYLDKKK